ncbi:chemotaxis protein CheW [Azospira inquinata]|uniref:Purine-binding chemotaxis protein CheW n=1 Tax=Azospira inquinata TaxID=2785627 RepID=A0A975SM10_9RHOO|nr:chemotaxis protein CheW [Azospira inquinata]QWT45871.1 purine-binding chemotaxis protein CheW [Azospira inquinata]QWT48805.1 purine-binding chemotaxis protein CheW [Azospira inquinata]
MGALVTTNQGSRASARDGGAVEQQQFLTFQLSGELFGLSILTVKEIIEFGTLTPVPMMPPYMRGVINLRGAVVPVIDLSVRFGRPPSQVTRRSCVVIVEVETEAGQQVLGVMVDAVNEVLDIPADQIEPPPSFGARIRAEFIAGMGKVAKGFVILLAADRVLSVEELADLSSRAESPVSAGE